MTVENLDIIKIYYENRNRENAEPMSKYMRNKFPFLGLKTPERKKLAKDFYKEEKKKGEIDWDFVKKCYELPEREFQYLAIGYLDRLKDLLTPEDMKFIQYMITGKSWWDSIDSISPIVGYVCLKYPEVKEDVISLWMNDENIWLKRVSIIFQLKYKEKTDTEFLAKAILENANTEEFFVDKAIGWALREYSKTNKEWVRQFIDKNTLSKLSVREGSKYI